MTGRSDARPIVTGAAQHPGGAESAAWQEPSDTELFEAAQRGDDRSWSLLVTRYAGALAAVARRHRLNDADVADAIQTTWLRCMEHAERIRAPERLRSWLLTTCRNECLRIIRHRSRLVPCDPARATGVLDRPDDHDPDTDPSERVLRAEARDVLRDAVAALPERQQRVVRELFVVDDRSAHWYAAVAARLQVPIGSLGPTRQRALQRLRRGHAVAALVA